MKNRCQQLCDEMKSGKTKALEKLVEEESIPFKTLKKKVSRATARLEHGTDASRQMPALQT